MDRQLIRSLDGLRGYVQFLPGFIDVGIGLDLTNELVFVVYFDSEPTQKQRDNLPPPWEGFRVVAHGIDRAGKTESEKADAGTQEATVEAKTDEIVSDDMSMTPEQIQTRKDILVRRVFAVNNILTQDGLDTQTECYLKDVFAAAKTYLLEVGVSGFLEDGQFVDFVKSLLLTCKMIFFEPLTGETRDFAWREIEAIERELKYFS